MRKNLLVFGICVLLICGFVVTPQNTVAANNPPVAVLSIFPDGWGEGYDAVHASGTGSYDPDGHSIVEYRFIWGDGRSKVGSDPEAHHFYCDEGTYFVELEVKDEHGLWNENEALKSVAVVNEIPIVSLSSSATVVSEGSPVSFLASFEDGGGSNDEPYQVIWDSDFGPTGPATHVLVSDCRHWGNPGSYDVGPEDYDYGDNGNFHVDLEVTDDVGGKGSNSVTVTVENVDPTIDYIDSVVYPNQPRTLGYWKHQCGVDPDNPPTPDHVGIRDEYVDYINANSVVWSSATKEDICADLWIDDESLMLQKLRRHLIAVWLNVAAQLLNVDSPLHAVIPASTIGEFIEEAEEAILDPIGKDLERLMTIADGICNGFHFDPVVGFFEAKATDPGSDDLIFEWDFDCIPPFELSNTHYNNGVGPDLLPSPDGAFPFSVIDSVTYSYPAHITDWHVCLTVWDDDGGMAEDEDQGQLSWSADWTFQYTLEYIMIYGGFIIPEITVTYVDWDSIVVPRDPYTGEPIYGLG